MIVQVLVTLFSPIVLFILYDFLKQLIRMWSAPPGPIPYPIFGNLDVFKHPKHLNFHRLKEKYGKVCSFSLPKRRAVLISDIDVAREVLIQQGEKVTGRGQSTFIAFMLTQRKDLITAEGERWKRLRKMAHSSLQMYGYGMDRLESIFVKESTHLHEKLKVLNGDPVNPRMKLALFLTNITCALMFGKRYDDEDPEFQDMMEYQECMKNALTANELVNILPFLRVLPIFKSIGWAQRAVEIRDRIFSREIEEHKESYNADHLRDFTDSLIQYTKEQEENSSTNSMKEDIILLLHDFVFAGVDTGLSSMGFAILYLVHNPQYQDMIVEEFDDVLGRTKYPTLQDRPRLPFFHATVMEVLRQSSVAFVGLAHRCLEPVKMDKYTVQKDTVFFYNIWSMNHDEKHWENPHEFNPKRWLDKDGKVKLGGKESFISFGLGRRNCVGETLAKAELFVFLGRLLRDFQLLPACEGELPSLEPDGDFLLIPKPSKIRFIPRNTWNYRQ